MEIKDIEKLAKLARIELTEEEKAIYLKDIGAILQYVDQIKEVVGKTNHSEKVPGVLHNVMREDDARENNEEEVQAIIGEFPESQDNYLKVKKIL